MQSEHHALPHVSHSTVDTSCAATGRSRASRERPQHQRHASSSPSYVLPYATLGARRHCAVRWAHRVNTRGGEGSACRWIRRDTAESAPPLRPLAGDARAMVSLLEGPSSPFGQPSASSCAARAAWIWQRPAGRRGWRAAAWFGHEPAVHIPPARRGAPPPPPPDWPHAFSLRLGEAPPAAAAAAAAAAAFVRSGSCDAPQQPAARAATAALVRR